MLGNPQQILLYSKAAMNLNKENDNPQIPQVVVTDVEEIQPPKKQVLKSDDFLIANKYFCGPEK